MSSINASIIDQQVDAIKDTIRTEAVELFDISDEEKLRSLAFTFLCVKTLLELENGDALDCLTEGSQDFGVDAFHISDDYDGSFTVTLFQSKYKRSRAEVSNFPENGVSALIQATRYLFDPNSALHHINQRLKTKVEQARSLIRDGYIPHVRLIPCNNGQKWSEAGDKLIKLAEFGDQVEWDYLNHDRLVSVMQAIKPVSATLRLSGDAITEDLKFSRIMIGKLPVREIAELIQNNGEKVLERNVRRYLGLQDNSVNHEIARTLRDAQDRANFYFYNNGVTLTCSKFSYNGLQKSDWIVKAENLQVINGGQTCMTIFRTLSDASLNKENIDQVYVMIRLYQLPNENDDLIRRITYATNNQNPVDLRDLRANDKRQRGLETDMKSLGFAYQRKRGGETSTDITPKVLAEAVLSVWRHKPHQAKFFSREHFGKLYDSIFSEDLNGAQAIIATLIYRFAENKRKRPIEGAPHFLAYGSCFIAMCIGKFLLNDLKLKLKDVDYKNFSLMREKFESGKELYFDRALNEIKKALHKLYGQEEVSLQQLAATFRRGDLIQELLSNLPN